jgi:4-hydroxybenzoate polyprenyltransferase
MFGKYTKAILGSLAAIGTWLGTALADGHITSLEWSGLAGVVVAAVLVATGTNTIDGLPYHEPHPDNSGI